MHDLHDQYLFPNYAPLKLMPSHGKGAKLWDTDGKEYIDLAAGIAVSSLGHANQTLISALTEQANKYWHVSNLLTNEPAIQLAKNLVDLTFADKVFFSNSGAEANEAALKLARRYAHEHHGADKFEIIAFSDGFHGRTLFTVNVGGQAKYSDGFGPKIAGITHLPFNDVEALEKAVSDKTCAVILEPIQGESGVRPASQAFVDCARSVCDKYDALLIFDEVQTGVMRTGDLYTYMSLGVTPDILTSAKGLGGGMPIGATLARGDVAEVFGVGVHGSTFGGNPLACAVANKVLELSCSATMRGHIHTVSKQLNEGLTSLNNEFNLFSEIRGAGLLVGCKLKPEYSGQAKPLLAALQESGVLALMAGENVLRLAPPLVITRDELHQGLARMTEAVKTFTTK